MLRVRRANDLFPSPFSAPFYRAASRGVSVSRSLGLRRPRRRRLLLRLFLRGPFRQRPRLPPFILHRVPFVGATCAARAARTPPSSARFLPSFPLRVFLSVSVTRVTLRLSPSPLLRHSFLSRRAFILPPCARSNQSSSTCLSFSFSLVPFDNYESTRSTTHPVLISLSFSLAPSGKLQPIQSTCSPYPYRHRMQRRANERKRERETERKRHPLSSRSPRTRLPGCPDACARALWLYKPSCSHPSSHSITPTHTRAVSQEKGKGADGARGPNRSAILVSCTCTSPSISLSLFISLPPSLPACLIRRPRVLSVDFFLFLSFSRLHVRAQVTNLRRFTRPAAVAAVVAAVAAVAANLPRAEESSDGITTGFPRPLTAPT